MTMVNEHKINKYKINNYKNIAMVEYKDIRHKNGYKKKKHKQYGGIYIK